MKAPKSNAASDPAPAGSHVARCISMIDLGTHEDSYQGGPVRDRRMVRLTFELPNEVKVFNPEKGEQPYLIGRDFTFSMFETAGLRIFLEEWRGKNFTDDEAADFDIDTLVGVPAMVSIKHTVKGDRTYGNLGSAIKLPKGTDCPKQINPSVVVSLDHLGEDTTMRAINSQPEWVRKKVESSKEWKRFEAGVDEEPEAVGVGKATEAEDDPFPF